MRYRIFKIFFPQMKPERRVAADIDLNEAEKSLLRMIETQSPVLLNDLKTQSGLSNKKWNKTIKWLTKNNLAKVNKTNEGLFVELV